MALSDWCALNLLCWSRPGGQVQLVPRVRLMELCQYRPFRDLVPVYSLILIVWITNETYPDFCLRVNGVIGNRVTKVLEMDANLMSWQDVVSWAQSLNWN